MPSNDADEKALQIEPDNPDVMTDLRNDASVRKGEPDKAVTIFSHVITIAPKHENARFNKGIVMLNDLQDRERRHRSLEGLLEVKSHGHGSQWTIGG